MGSVKVDVFKKDREWNAVNLSTVDSIKGLLKFRSQFDLLLERTVTVDINVTDVDLTEMSSEVHCLYIWLDEILERVKFSEQQRMYLQDLSDGMSEKEMSEKHNVTQRNVNKVINTICKKIKKEAHLDWLRWHLIKKGLITKKCKKCKRELPIVDEFFSPDNSIADGYKKICKKCR